MTKAYEEWFEQHEGCSLKGLSDLLHFPSVSTDSKYQASLRTCCAGRVTLPRFYEGVHSFSDKELAAFDWMRDLKEEIAPNENLSLERFKQGFLSITHLLSRFSLC